MTQVNELISEISTNGRTYRETAVRAVIQGDTATLGVLRKYFRFNLRLALPTLPFIAVLFKQLKILKLLIKPMYGFELVVLNRRKETLAIVAAKYGFTEGLEFLRDCINRSHYNLGQRCPKGFNAMDWATLNGHDDCIQLLSKAGCEKSKETIPKPCNLLEEGLLYLELAGFNLDISKNDRLKKRNLAHLAAQGGDKELLQHLQFLGENLSQADCYGVTPAHEACLNPKVIIQIKSWFHLCLPHRLMDHWNT
jgi:ankyrin repeat protein